MGFLGTSHSKFIVGTTEVELLHSLIDPTYMIPDEIKHTSIIDGVDNYIWKGHYSKFIVTVYLFKYDNPTEKLLELYQYKDILIDKFYPYSDGDFIKNIAGFPIRLYLKEIIPYYLIQNEYYDACNLIFVASKYNSYANTPSPFGYGYLYGYFYGYGL